MATIGIHYSVKITFGSQLPVKRIKFSGGLEGYLSEWSGRELTFKLH